MRILHKKVVPAAQADNLIATRLTRKPLIAESFLTWMNDVSKAIIKRYENIGSSLSSSAFQLKIPSGRPIIH